MKTKQYYGLPYKGGKQAHAKELFDVLPHGGRFVDLFCGGCSMTDYAMTHKLYDSYLANDKNQMMPKAYVDALDGKLIPADMHFITKEHFHAHPEDAYARICYSFCNRLAAYIYGEPRERAMKSAHYVICDDDYSLIKDIVSDEAMSYLKAHVTADDFPTRRLQFTAALKALNRNRVDIGILYIKMASQHNCAEHLRYINRILRIAKHYDNLTTSNISYEQYEYQDGDVVYCDPPYAGTDKYVLTGDFDTEAFWQWARTREYPVYVSEVQAPDDFRSIWTKRRSNCMSKPSAEHDGQKSMVENLFIHERFL